MKNNVVNVLFTDMLFDKILDNHRILLSVKSDLPNRLFLNSVHSLFFFEVFLQSTLDYLFDNLVFVVCRVTSVASFNLDWSWYSCSDCESFSTDTIDFYFIEVLSVNSWFHKYNNKRINGREKCICIHLEISLLYEEVCING